MKTLHLILKKKWFDMIKSGEKKEEYRALTKHWESRLVDNSAGSISFKYFDTVTFTNGYAKNAPRFEIELNSITIDSGLECWGAHRFEEYFVIKLGEIIHPEPTPSDLDVSWPEVVGIEVAK